MLVHSKKISVLIVGVLMLIVGSCQQRNERNPKGSAELIISSNISPLRAYGTSWEKGDAIGVYAVRTGSELQSSSIYDNASNICFITDGTGGFKSSGAPLYLKPGENLDLIAYYPYSDKVGSDYMLSIDVSDQSKPAHIDLLYARSTSPVSVSQPNASLVFSHKMSQLLVTIVAQNGLPLDGVKSTLDGTVVKGTFNLANGEVALGSYKAALSGKKISESGGTASLSYLLIPGQTLEGSVISFTVNGRKYNHKIKASEAVVIESGHKYTLPFAIKSADQLELLTDGVVIGPMEGSGESNVDAEIDSDVEVIEISVDDNNGGGPVTTSYEVGAKPGETWSAVTDQDFVALSQSTTDGPGVLTMIIDENTSYEERYAQVIITILPKNSAASHMRSSGKKIVIINITQAGKRKPEPEADKLLLDATFANGLENFTEQSVFGDAVWHHSTYKGQAYAKMTGYDSTAKRAMANEDWLISPAFDMSGAKIAKLTFDHAINFAENMQEETTLYFSVDYTNDVNNATWIKVPITNYPASNGWDFVHSGEILFPDAVLDKSSVHFALKYKSSDMVASTWQVKNLQVWADAGKVIGGIEPDPNPDPDPNPEPIPGKAHYMEIPIVNNGKMTDGFYMMHTSPDSHFAGGSTVGGIRRNYTVFISKNSRIPYWVAYPMYPDCMGSVKRTNAWNWDPFIPNEYQPDLTRSYSHNQSRGHMLASSARTASTELNKTTFYFSNMIPQYQTHNGGNWAVFENKEKVWGSKNDNDTIYVVTGPIFDPNTTNTCTDRRGNRIPIPTHSWKVMLRYDRADKTYYSIAVRIPNSTTSSKWYEHVTTVAALEKELGVTFFTHLPQDIANEVKNQKDTSKWD